MPRRPAACGCVVRRGFVCRPHSFLRVVHRAALGLAMLTGADKQACIDALVTRGTSYRGMVDALLPLVAAPSPRPRGSNRERKTGERSG